MRRGPQPIGDVLAELMARHGYAQQQNAAALEAAWNEAVGEPVAPYTRVGSLRRGTLEVVVANSTLVQELVFQKPKVLASLGQLLPDVKIKNIRFRVGAA